MNLTRIEHHNDGNDFVIEGKHAKVSQNKVAEITKVNQSTVSRWLCTNKDSSQNTFDAKDLIDFLQYIILDSKRTKLKVKKHCLALLLQLADTLSIQNLLEDRLTFHYHSLLSRAKENLINSDIEDGSFVYLIQNLTTGNLKIGYSINPCRRFIKLQLSTDCELRLLAFFEGTVSDEQLLLSKFQQYQVRGEWFMPVPEIYLTFGLTQEFVKKSSKQE